MILISYGRSILKSCVITVVQLYALPFQTSKFEELYLAPVVASRIPTVYLQDAMMQELYRTGHPHRTNSFVGRVTRPEKKPNIKKKTKKDLL